MKFLLKILFFCFPKFVQNLWCVYFLLKWVCLWIVIELQSIFHKGCINETSSFM